jgi:hypothetical protein
MQLLSAVILVHQRYQMQPCSGGRIDLLGKGEKVKSSTWYGCRRLVLISPKFQTPIESRFEHGTIKSLALR